MNPNDPTRPDAGEANVARLLEQAYDPEKASPEFVRRVEARLLAVAAEEARWRAAALPPPRVHGGRLAAMTAAAALLGAITLGFQFGPGVSRPTPSDRAVIRPAASRVLMRDRLIAAPRPAGPRAAVVAAGTVLTTRGGERRRVRLDDGSVLFLNQNTQARYDGDRHVTLTRGEVFVEVAPRSATEAHARFTVQAPRRAVQALGTKFIVRAGDAGTGVAVTQGKVRVGRTVLTAGQQLAPDGNRPTPAPRASHLLAWTRDLVTTAAGALVPASRHAGGALVAVDPRGHAANLSLRKYHIDIHVEDGFARTTIDQTYFNHTPQRLEGTFYFPLPPDASLSRLAMYVNGTLTEGGMVERDYGRVVFDQIVKKMQDPALLEWVDGSTFKMRVFPLEGRQEKRIVLSYTQRLPALYGRLSYRFPAGHSLEAVRDWSFHARVKEGAGRAWQCDSHALKAKAEGRDLILKASAHKVRVDRDIVLELGEDTGAAAAARFSRADQDGARYLMVRYRPELTGSARRQRRDWVFLVETSGDRNPLLARTQVEIVRTLLANAEQDDTFAVLTAGTRVRSWSSTPRPITPENVAAAINFLEGAHLIGALDLDRGLEAAARMLAHGHNPHLVHIGSGLAVLGERRGDRLLQRLPVWACYVGVGVGKHWARSWMKRAADRSQGYFTQINPDEPVAWRAFDLLATLNTPRLLDVRVVDAAGKAMFLSDASSVCQGEELCAVSRLDAGSLPQAVTVTGLLDGKSFHQVLPVEGVRTKADYLPRTWARLEIERLLAADAVKNKDKIIALSKAMYVMTPYTSLLVLENEAMYAQFKVDRGRKDHWAMYPCPAKISVVYEPLPGGNRYDNNLGDVRSRNDDALLVLRLRQLIDGQERRQVKTASMGPSVSSEAVGIVGAPSDVTPSTIPPPPGTGGGTGGVVIMPAELDRFRSVKLTPEVLANLQAKPEELAAALKQRIDPADLYNVTIIRDGSVRALQYYLHLQTGIDYPNRTAGFDLNAVRRDCARLLAHYEQQAAARPSGRAAADLAARVLRTADRWRVLDADGTSACVAAARILRQLGERDLAWEYETTALAAPTTMPAAWLGLAKWLAEAKDHAHADQAYATAFALEPANARILWDRAMNMFQAHRPARAQALLRQLAEGTWGPQYKEVQGWARALRQRGSLPG